MVQSNNIFNENPIGFPSNLGQQGHEHIQQSNINQISHVNNDNDNNGFFFITPTGGSTIIAPTGINSPTISTGGIIAPTGINFPTISTGGIIAPTGINFPTQHGNSSGNSQGNH